MNIILFFILFIGLFESFNRMAARMLDAPGIERILASFTIFWAWVVLVAWGLSLPHLLTPVAFGMVSILTIGIGFVFFPKPEVLFLEQIRDLLRRAVDSARGNYLNLLLLLVLALWIGNALFRVLLLPPANWDALTYHLPMVANWLQHGYVGFYESTSIRQVVFPVNAEILQMFHVIFLGKDDLVRLVQFEAFIVSLLGVYYLSRSVGMTVTGSLGAALFFLTLPLGLLQTYSSQNDISVVAGFVISLVWLAAYLTTRRKTALVLLALSLGLLLGVKLHMLFLVSVFALIMIAIFLIQPGRSWRDAVLFFAAFALSAALLGFDVYFNNLRVFGEIMPRLGALDTRETGAAIIAENLGFFANWWFVTAWDLASTTTWNHDSGHFGPLFGYLVIPLTFVGMVILGRRLIKREGVFATNALLIAAILLVLGTALGFWYTHHPRPYDLRYLLSFPVVLSVVSVWTLSVINVKLEKLFAGLILIAAVPTTVLAAMNDNIPNIKDVFNLQPWERVVTHVQTSGQNAEFFGKFDELAREGESIIFCGAEDDWSYTLFGEDFSRHVFYATSFNSFINSLSRYNINWVVVRDLPDYQDIIDFVRGQPSRFEFMKSTRDSTGDYFYRDILLYRLQPEFWHPTWYSGLYNDKVSGGDFVLGSAVAGKFIFRCLVDPIYKGELALTATSTGESPKVFPLHESGPHSLEFILPVPGEVACHLNRSYVPQELGINPDKRRLGVVVQSVEFYYDRKPSSLVTVQVYP